MMNEEEKWGTERKNYKISSKILYFVSLIYISGCNFKYPFSF